MDKKINYSNKLLVNYLRRPFFRVSSIRNNKLYQNNIKMYDNPSVLSECLGTKRNYKDVLDRQMEEIDNLKDQLNHNNMIVEKKNKIIEDKNFRIKELSEYAQKQSEKLSEVVKNNLRLSEENFDYKKKISYLEELLKNISGDKYIDKKHEMRDNKCVLKENANILQELNDNISKLNLNLSSMKLNDKDDKDDVSIDININKNKNYDDGVSSDSDVIIVGYNNKDKKVKLL